VKNFQSCRLVLAGFAVLACIAAQSPCGGDPRSRFIDMAASQRNGIGVASAIPFTGVVPSVVGDPTLAYAEWKQGVGCPTNLTGSYACFSSSDPADKVNSGLFLVKTGPTSTDPAVDLSAYPAGVNADLAPYAAAQLQGVAGSKVSDLTELGYDLRKPDSNAFFNQAGSHCGLRSPRFNVVTQGVAGLSTHRFYCSYGTLDNVNQGWIRLRWTPDLADPPMDPLDTIQSISIVADEGQDPLAGNPDLGGLSVLDNIDVNGILVGAGLPATPPPPPGGGGDDEDDGQGEDDGHNCFHFNGNWTHGEKSRLSYTDKAMKLKFVATSGARSIHSTGPKCVSFVADGTVNRKPGYTATFEACDRSGPTAIGTFFITITGPGGYRYEKTSSMSKGKVKVRG
jgi:hypothetical protein